MSKEAVQGIAQPHVEARHRTATSKLISLS
jgi:hypothetical protein